MAIKGRNKKNKAKTAAHYNMTPKMPKDSSLRGTTKAGQFKPGQGGSMSAKVGSRGVRKGTKGGRQMISNKQDIGFANTKYKRTSVSKRYK